MASEKGKIEADRIKEQSASRGSNMHLHLEVHFGSRTFGPDTRG